MLLQLVLEAHLVRVLEVVDVDVLDLAVVDGELLVVDVEGGHAARAAAPRLARHVTTSRWTWGGGA